MTQRIDLATTKKPVRDFIQGLGRIREPVELLVDGRTVAKIVAPQELSEAEKDEIRRKGWAFVAKARAKTRGVPAKEIANMVDRAVNKVRSRK